MNTSNNKYSIIFTKRSQKEIFKIYKYSFKKAYSEQYARKLMKEIESKIKILETFPKAYSELIIEERKNKYRKIVIKNYIIIYTIKEEKKEIYILHIFHQKSNYLEKL